MQRAFLIGTPPLSVTLRRSDRARRFSLRVSRTDGQVTLSLPRWAPEAEALRFAASQEGWIRRALAARPQVRLVGIGALVPVEGRELLVEAAPLRSVRLAEDRLLVPGSATAGPRIVAYLKLMARQKLQVACDRHAATLGKPYARITLRDTTSRWGSCTTKGNLMFSWRLIMAPPPVLDYVAAHEVAHLAEMNHSDAFWSVVARLRSDYASHRDWLRRHGARLQAIAFRD